MPVEYLITCDLHENTKSSSQDDFVCMYRTGEEGGLSSTDTKLGDKSGGYEPTKFVNNEAALSIFWYLLEQRGLTKELWHVVRRRFPQPRERTYLIKVLRNVANYLEQCEAEGNNRVKRVKATSKGMEKLLRKIETDLGGKYSGVVSDWRALYNTHCLSKGVEATEASFEAVIKSVAEIVPELTEGLKHEDDFNFNVYEVDFTKGTEE